jgi:hypothetical protein
MHSSTSSYSEAKKHHQQGRPLYPHKLDGYKKNFTLATLDSGSFKS